MEPQNLLIFRIGHLGDTVIALPALWAIRRKYPKARLTLLTNIDLGNDHYVSPADVLPRTGLVDHVIAYPTNLGKVQTSAALAALAVKLRKGRFDAVIYLMPRVRSKKQIRRDRGFFRIARIAEVWGNDYHLGHRLDPPVPGPAPFVESEADFLLQLLEDSGIKPAKKETDLLLTAEEIDSADSWYAAHQTGNDQHIAVCTGGKFPYKMWDEGKYLEVIERLIAEFNVVPIVFGGQEDREKGSLLIGSSKAGVNAAGELSVRESAALLRRCKIYLGNDTGTMHLAAAVNVPCVAIFSGMDWVGRWSPFGGNNRIFRSKIECPECVAEDQNSRHTCLESIGVDEVFGACSDLMAS